MRTSIREVFDSDLIDNLEFLQKEAIERGRTLRAKRNAMRLNPMDFIKDTAQGFFTRTESKKDILGEVRRNRILRHRAGEVYGLDPSAAGDPNLEQAIDWFDVVVENIEHELDVIERRQILWLTLTTAVAAAVAAMFAFFALLFDVGKTFLGYHP